MPICVCDYCGKAFNNAAGSKLCSGCSKIIEDSYIKARKYIYQNPKESDFASIVAGTEVPEKALSYLINKGRIMVANREGGGAHCRACGKETSSGALCDSCMAKIMAEKLTQKSDEQKRPGIKSEPGRKSILPVSYNTKD